MIQQGQDIEQAERAERERRLTLDLMRSMSMPTSLQGLMREVLQLVGVHTDAQAIGIRLREGLDYPYFEYRGFSHDFILAETHLCPKSNAVGQPVVLDCMCGNVLQERTDPTQPFFTEQGSFWSNCTTRLLASTTSAERQSNTRNRCNGEGYESVALIPLRFQRETFGLLQVNDRRPGRFTPQSIDFLERLAAAVAVALHQRQTDQRLEDALAAMRVLLNEVHHRVKNSLQLVASLLKLGAGSITDTQAAAIVSQSQERIQAIALAHEMLFLAPSASRIVLDRYLDELVRHVVTAWSGDSSRIDVGVTVQPVEVDTSAMVSLGLIATELVGNALRHAFPDERRGTIRVVFGLDGEGKIRLSVRDDGIGLPTGVNVESSPGFGLRMIGILAKQIGASVQIENGAGNTVHIALPRAAAEAS